MSSKNPKTVQNPHGGAKFGEFIIEKLNIPTRKVLKLN